MRGRYGESKNMVEVSRWTRVETGSYNSPTMRIRVVVETQLNEEGTLPHVGGHALELEGLEAGPAEKIGVGRGEFAKILG